MATTLPRPADTPAVEEPQPAIGSLRRWYALMLVGGALGVVTAAWQTVERIVWEGDPNAGSICEINAVLSCSSVFSHWQSSALGIPNSLIALPLFGMFAAAGLAGVLGSRLSKSFLATMAGFAAFFAVFIFWYLEQSAFSIGILCLFCLGCFVNLVIAGTGVIRVAAAERAFGEGRFGRQMTLQAEAGVDLIVWAGLVAVVALMLFAGLAL